MVQSVLEMTTDLVKAHLETHRLSLDQVGRMLQRTHAQQVIVQRPEETLRQAPSTAPDERMPPRVAWDTTVLRTAGTSRRGTLR